MTDHDQNAAIAWQAALDRAERIASTSRWYGRGIYDREARNLLALLLYAANHADHSEPDDLAVVLDLVNHADDTIAGAGRRDHLHQWLTTTLTSAGHDPTTLTADPVVTVGWPLFDLTPAHPPESLSEYPANMVHPRGSTELGRATPTVHQWLDEYQAMVRPRASGAGTAADEGA